MAQRILAIDDEIHMLKLLERIVSEKTPYQISITNNPLEVRQILDESQFDLVITDLKMPGLDGMDILRMIKENKRFEEVIIITAFGSLESAVEALSKGVFDYITKPFKKEQIIFTVDRVMRWQRIRREADKLREIFEKEPFQEAQALFKKEYIRRISARTNGDVEKMVELSGLSSEDIESFLKGQEE